MRIRFLSAAHHDVTEAADHYTRNDPEAGRRFFDELDRSVALIADNPHMGRSTERGAQRFSLQRFPYDVIYQVRPDEIVITAVSHHRRDQSYWIHRLD